MKRCLLIACLFLSIAKVSFAQKDTLVYYLNDAGMAVSDPQQAAYRLVIFPEKWVKNEKVSEIKGINLDGKLRFTGYSSNHGLPVTLDGIFTEYYATGNKMRVRRFDGGFEEDAMEYYEDGKVKAESHRTHYGDMANTEYYADGKIKLEKQPTFNSRYDETEYYPAGNISRQIKFDSTGQHSETTFYKSGGIKKSRMYKNASGDEEITAYYPNGKLYYSILFSSGKTGLIKKYMECRDSTGNIAVQNGNGHWVQYSDDFKFKFQQGKTVNGLADSVWQITLSDNNGEYDTYDKGKLVGHKSYALKQDSAGVNEQAWPLFSGGLPAFYSFLGKHLRYPPIARELDISGRIFVSFTVGEDGNVSQVNVLDGIGAGCDEEGERVMRLSPPWKPAIKNGKPITTQYIMPIELSLTKL